MNRPSGAALCAATVAAACARAHARRERLVQRPVHAAQNAGPVPGHTL